MSTPVPLTAAQSLFWTGQKLAGEAPLYNMAWRFDLHLPLDPALFAHAFQDVAAACDAMAICFSENGQHSAAIPDFPAFLDVTESELETLIPKIVEAPFDLSRGVYRTALARLSDTHWVWLFVCHHIACDAQSGAVLAERVSDRYRALAAGHAELPSPTPGFLGRLPQTDPPRIGDYTGSFPYAASRGGDPVSERVPVPVDPGRVETLASDPAFRLFTPDLSRYALYLTAYMAFISRVTGDTTISVGTPSHNRLTAEDRDCIGLFVEVLPIATTVTPEDSFQSLHAKVKSALGAFLKTAKPGAVSTATGLGFGYVLNYIQARFGTFADAPMQVQWVHPGAHDAQHALRLHVMDFTGTGTAEVALDVNCAVGSETSPQSVADHFSTFFGHALETPEAPLNTLALTDQNITSTGPAQDDCPPVLESFLRQARTTPDSIAVEEGGTHMTYAELSVASARLASRLHRNGVEPGQSVILHMKRSADYVIAALGTLMAGAHFVPVATSNPPARVQTIAGLADAVAAITDPQRRNVLTGIPVLDPRAEDPPMDPVASDPAYMIFTSGSTGTPKGVVIGQSSLARYIDWAARTFGGPNYPLFTSISFDLTITSLFVPLTRGGRLIVYPEPDTGPDMAVLSVFAEDRVDTVKLTPAHLSLACSAGQPVGRIRTLVLGGENLTTGLCHRARDILGPVRILNEYGPTEAVVGCMIHEFDDDPGPSVPIGRPADGVEISLRDAGGNTVPKGVIGEICIGGRLAEGYKDPAQTSEKFRNGRYHSGDLGRLRPDGIFEYLGRADQQTKIGGVRTEPAEIESALLDLPLVRAAFVGRPERDIADQTCTRCGLAADYPGIEFGKDGLCAICADYETYRDRAQAYFAPPSELRDKIEAARTARTGKYDAIMLLSGGKDSTYAACRLAELTGDVLALTLDNGYLSEQAITNIHRVVDDLGWEHRFMKTEAMNRIFVDSLKRHSNVCQGCFKTVYTLALREARAEGVPAIVTGLSRGQFFETRLTPELFQHASPSRNELEDMVHEARRRYHAEDDAVSHHLATGDIRGGTLLDKIEFIDLYRYIDVPVSEIYRYLSENSAWKRPDDTGRSTNCLINDLGIYFHRKREGFHNYALPYSWDVRMGHKTRDQAVDELNDEIDVPRVEKILEDIGFDEPVERDEMVAYVVTKATETEIWSALRKKLPGEMMPKAIVIVDEIPITPNGKVDRRKLPMAPRNTRSDGTKYVAPKTSTQKELAGIIKDVLTIDRVGLYDDFFDLGGDSLAAVKIAIAANEAGYAVPATALFEHRTLYNLAAYAEGLTDTGTDAPETLLEVDEQDLASIYKALE